MEKITVVSLLEKYWQAETTLGEEKALADYFRGGSVDPELQQYSEIFAYFDEEAMVAPAPDFGDRILQHIDIQSDSQGSSPDQPGIATAPVALARTIRPFGAGLLSAAAVIAALVIGLFVLAPPTQHGAQTDPRNSLATIRHGAIQDTYDDPEQALAVVRHALLVASAHLNQGRQELTGAHK
jgi:hypothetical protein